MSRRPLTATTALATTALAALLIALGGCAALAGPTAEDRAAWRAWFEQAMEAGGGIATGAAFSAPDDATPVDVSPAQPYRAVELRCDGTDRATFTLTYTGTGEATTVTQEIVCHQGGALTPIAIPIAVGDLTRFAASATSPDGEGYWVAALQK
ncbi:MAG: hypothetical protein J0I43_15405 [Microbacterium sp.]|uniref:hypothetical protein n=1 Tax=Microbacterium sp. TaxID=51671 RepID=UPI001AD600B0|nr:hypothetical protein [Microbacterium sp.]MBN9178738.1 hypothetical protein [Microbacterium sp.]